MAHTRRAVLGMTAVTIGLAGCAGAGDGSSGSSPTGTEGTTDTERTATDAEERTTTEATTTTAGGTASASIAVVDHPELGDILVDGDGMTLYMFDSDERGAGASTCSDGCAEAWPPLTAEDPPEAGDDVTAELSTFEREDGSTQVAAGGWPLYYWQGDEEPGDATGQGVNDVWWVLRPDGTPVGPESSDEPTVQVDSNDEYGDVLVGVEGRTLYMFDSDEQGGGASTCYDGCADAWPPLTVDGSASAGEAVSAELTTFEREDGSAQVAANGWPLYYFASDESAGAASGQGVNDVWWVLDSAGEPIRTNTSTPTDTPGSGSGGSGGGGDY